MTSMLSFMYDLMYATNSPDSLLNIQKLMIQYFWRLLKDSFFVTTWIVTRVVRINPHYIMSGVKDTVVCRLDSITIYNIIVLFNIVSRRLSLTSISTVISKRRSICKGQIEFITGHCFHSARYAYWLVKLSNYDVLYYEKVTSVLGHE